MSIRKGVRRGLVSLDSRLGVRKWLREDKTNEAEAGAPKFSDPFAPSEAAHRRPNTVLDIGASHGQFAGDALRAFPGVKIYSFEPIPECYEELVVLSQSVPS